jgi:hypothetical protein
LAAGAVWAPPYPAVIALVDWVGRRRNWYEFDGWCVSRGIEPLRLPGARALNLIQHFITSRLTDEKEYRKLVDSLTGPLLTDERRQRAIAARDPSEPPMPSWWDDDDADESNMLAARQLGVG